jgi:hypothetical protein
VSDEKSDAEILENLGRMAQWNVAQEELRRLAHGDMMKFRVGFLEWLRRHWELMTLYAEKMKVLEERAVRAEREVGELRREMARLFHDD